MDNLDSVQSDAPTSLTSDAVNDVPTQMPDAKIDDMFSSLFPEAAAEVPVVEETVEDESLEVSEDTELAPSEDDSNIDTPEDTEEVESEVEDTPDSVVSFDEMKDHQFEIDGKAYSAGDLKAALGRQAKQEEARKEVETSREELNADKVQFEAQRETLQTAQTLNAGQQQIAQLQNIGNQLMAQKQEAVGKNDTNSIVLINEKLAQLDTEFNKVNTEVQNAQSQQAADAAQRLTDFGLGDLNTDTQRQGLFKDYAFKNIPKGLVGVVNTNPELLAMVEKARLYDKSKEDMPKGKLKGQKRSLKGGASKAPKSAPKKSSFDSKVDSMFS